MPALVKKIGGENVQVAKNNNAPKRARRGRTNILVRSDGTADPSAKPKCKDDGYKIKDAVPVQIDQERQAIVTGGQGLHFFVLHPQRNLFPKITAKCGSIVAACGTFGGGLVAKEYVVEQTDGKHRQNQSQTYPDEQTKRTVRRPFSRHSFIGVKHKMPTVENGNWQKVQKPDCR